MAHMFYNWHIYQHLHELKKCKQNKWGSGKWKGMHGSEKGEILERINLGLIGETFCYFGTNPVLVCYIEFLLELNPSQLQCHSSEIDSKFKQKQVLG